MENEMKAAVLVAPKQPLEIEELSISKPGPHEVLIRTAACGLCHSDLHFIEGSYSHALEVPPGWRLLFVSGQIPEALDGTVPTGFEAQCHAAWANVLAALSAAGLGPEHLVKVTTYLTDRDQAEGGHRVGQVA